MRQPNRIILRNFTRRRPEKLRENLASPAPPRLWAAKPRCSVFPQRESQAVHRKIQHGKKCAPLSFPSLFWLFSARFLVFYFFQPRLLFLWSVAKCMRRRRRRICAYRCAAIVFLFLIVLCAIYVSIRFYFPSFVFFSSLDSLLIRFFFFAPSSQDRLVGTLPLFFHNFRVGFC